jgi:AcrR family transcriptional regulator
VAGHDPGPERLLPVIGQIPAERADAARNRKKIMEAAAGILATRGASCLTLDEVARQAGVGIGTVYRRFGDRARLVSALIEDRELQFQEAFLTGPPPLGPGAPPADRIRAFLHALLDRMEDQWELLLLEETSAPSRRYDTSPYRTRHLHLVSLIDQVKPGADSYYLAESLLALLTPSLLNYQIRQRHLTVERIKAGLDELLCWAT